MDVQTIEERLEAVLRNAGGGIPLNEVAEMIALARAGEPGVALENFCTQLEEYDIIVSRDVANELRMLASAMGMKLGEWLDKSAD